MQLIETHNPLKHIAPWNITILFGKKPIKRRETFWVYLKILTFWIAVSARKHNFSPRIFLFLFSCCSSIRRITLTAPDRICFFFSVHNVDRPKPERWLERSTLCIKNIIARLAITFFPSFRAELHFACVVQSLNCNENAKLLAKQRIPEGPGRAHNADHAVMLNECKYLKAPFRRFIPLTLGAADDACAWSAWIPHKA